LSSAWSVGLLVRVVPLVLQRQSMAWLCAGSRTVAVGDPGTQSSKSKI